MAQDSNFLENKEEDFKAKSENVFYFGDDQTIDRLSRNIVDKLGPQKILFITGPPAVGKSTFMLFLLDKCLPEGESIGEWQKVFFLNPNAEKLKKSLEIIDGIMEDKSDEISPEDVLLVIDALHREEEEEEYIDKCYDLFTKILEDKYSLVVTIRDSELAILKEKLGNKYNEFKNIIEEAPVDPKKARIKRIFMKYLNYYKDKIKLLDIDLSFEDITKYVQEGEKVAPGKSESYQELDKCIQKVVKKSGGVPGYVRYLMDDISRKGILSNGIIEKYPAGMTALIRGIIERDYLIGDDKVLPLLILFLTKKKGHALTWEFLSSFIEWGVDVIDKTRFDKGVILERARNFINFYTADIRDGSIYQYYLISHWRKGIEDILKQRGIQIFTEVESELGDRIAEYLTQKEKELKGGQLPVNFETWLVVAEVVKLSYERKNRDVLKYATQFFTEHQDDKERCAFLKKTLSSLWKEKMNEEFSARDYEHAAVSLENAIEVGIDDASLHSMVSVYYYEKGDLPKALKHSQRAVELKPAEPTYLGKHGWILEREGVELEEKGDYSEAISKFEDAVKYYGEALEIIDKLSERRKGRRKSAMSGYRWRIGYCSKRAELIRMSLRSEDEKYLKEKAEKCFRDDKNYETNGDYATALKMFLDAKELMSKYIEITEVLEEDIRNLINRIYRRIGVCYEKKDGYEKKDDYEKAAKYYTIHADLNEYAPDPLKMYKEYGNKFKGWVLYGKAIYCFTRALKVDQNNYDFLSELADLSARLGKFDDAVKYYKESLEEQKAVIGLVAESDKEWLNRYKNSLKIRENIGNKLISICNVADLAIDGEKAGRLSSALYDAGMTIGEINPKSVAESWKLPNKKEEKIRNKLQDLKLSCLCRAYILKKEVYLFNWNDILENDSERFIGFLENNLKINGLRNATIEKTEDNKHIKVMDEKNVITLKLNREGNKVTLEIRGRKPYEYILKEEDGKLNIYKKNDRIINELETLTNRHVEEILKEYGNYYKRDLERRIENPLDALCRIHSTAISTLISLHKAREEKNKSKIKSTKSNYSGYWGWIGGGRINKIYRADEYKIKISPNVGVKCFDLSLKLREKNKKSSNGLGWALFYAGRYDDAIQAFKDDLREDMNPNNPYAITGIGIAYEEKGDYKSAEKYLREGAKLRFELRGEDDPQKVIIDLKKSAGRLENLAFLGDSRNEKLRLLREALEVYGMMGAIAQEIKLEEEQNLFKLEAANLEKYISNVEMGVLEGYNI